MNSSKFVIRSLRKADLATIRDLFTKEFVYHEPAASHLRFTEPEFYKLYDRFALHLDLSTSVVAEEIHEDKRQPSEIVSSHINIPLAAPVDLEGLAEPVPLMKLFDELHKPFDDVLRKASISEERVLHPLMGATKEEYHGKGVYKEVQAFFGQQMIRHPKWDAAVAECTSPITRHLMTKHFGWTEEKFIGYEDFEVDGQRPFEGLEGGVALVWKDYRRTRGKS
ncbi:hypothetical protein BJ165DRAFT_1496555 [Panaeolus papilionaceus]|nr:hypothetical protein BJ165DRAFT_1496555 [Panaeolus papilionaceus]